MRKLVRYFVLSAATIGAALIYFPARYGVIDTDNTGLLALRIPSAEGWFYGGVALAILLIFAVMCLLLKRLYIARSRGQRPKQ